MNSGEGLRVGIVGAGMIADVHRRAILASGATLVGVVASTPSRSEQAALRWGGGVVGFSDAAALFAGVDVVHVASPNHLHRSTAISALEAGKHVVCEKPLGLSEADAAAMVASAAKADRVATVPFVYRFHPIVREIRERIRRGELGTVLGVHGSYLQDWMLDPHVSNWRVDPGSGGSSRAFADIGSHWFDLVEWVTGNRVSALTALLVVAHSRRPQSGKDTFSTQPTAPQGVLNEVRTEDTAIVTALADGIPFNTVISQVSAGRKNRLWFEVDLSGGSAVFDQENSETAWLGGTSQSTIVHRDSGAGSAEQRRLSSLPAGHSQGYQQCFDAFVEDTYAAVNGEFRDGLPTFADGLRSSALVDCVLRSHKQRGWADVSGSRAATEQLTV